MVIEATTETRHIAAVEVVMAVEIFKILQAVEVLEVLQAVEVLEPVEVHHMVLGDESITIGNDFRLIASTLQGEYLSKIILVVKYGDTTSLTQG